MRHFAALVTVAVVSMATGCVQKHVYEIDFSQARGFQWNGKLRLTQVKRLHVGPMLTPVETAGIELVEFKGTDGRTASVDAAGYKDVPIAAVSLAGPEGMEVLGTRSVWQGSNVVFVADPELLAAAQRQAQTQPASPVRRLGPESFSSPTEKRPYLQHLEGLTLADWWSVALTDARDVSMEFRLPAEGIVITMYGDPQRYGPQVLEIRSSDGKVLRRFERQQIEVVPAKDVTTVSVGTRPDVARTDKRAVCMNGHTGSPSSSE